MYGKRTLENPQTPLITGFVRVVAIIPYGHTFCVHSLQKLTVHGEDPYAVLPLLMTYMGHRSVQATNQYIHLSAESFPAILKRSEALFGDLIPLEGISNEDPI